MMNRLQLWPQAPQVLAAQRRDAEHSRLTTAHRGDPAHSFFAPLHYEPNYAYPLLIWLHGPGGNERQLQHIMPMVSLRNYVGIAPRGNGGHDDGSGGYWWDDSADELAAAERAAMECVELACQRFHVARHRVFLAGFECGGTMAFRIGLRHPQRIAGVLSVGGPFPTGHMPLANLNQARSLPLFVAQGRDAKKYTLERACAELRLFHAAGMNVTLRQYPCGDELTTQMLHDMDVWMMERVTGMPSCSDGSTLPSSLDSDLWN